MAIVKSRLRLRFFLNPFRYTMDFEICLKYVNKSISIQCVVKSAFTIPSNRKGFNLRLRFHFNTMIFLNLRLRFYFNTMDFASHSAFTIPFKINGVCNLRLRFAMTYSRFWSLLPVSSALPIVGNRMWVIKLVKYENVW